MGVLFSKPLTKDDLTAALQPIKDDIALLQTDVTALKTDVTALKNDVTELKTDVTALKKDVSEVKAGLLVPEGDEEAQKATVVIKSFDDPDPIGHGLVVRAPNHRGIDGETYYLLTAAHVLVHIAQCSAGVSISWSANTRLRFEESTPDAIILNPRYISKGSHDYGFMELKSTIADTVGTNLTTKALRLGSIIVGQSVVAQGKVYLRGSVTSVIDDESRFSVVAHTIPGSSGAPIFNNQCQLIGVVRGGSKHRGHAYGTSDEDSAVVYADAIQVDADNPLYWVPEVHFDMLNKAEFVPSEVASGKKKLFDIKTDEHGQQTFVETEGTEELWRLVGALNIEYTYKSELTLEKLMKALEETVRKDHSIQTTWNDTSDFQLVFVADQSSGLPTPQGSIATEAVV